MDTLSNKSTADALQEAEERFHSLVDAVEEYAIFRVDSDGRVASWNEGARQIKGYDAEEILGEHISTFYTESARSAGVPEQNLAEATERGSLEDEGWRVRENGSRFWATVSITALRDDGTHRGYLKVTRDMTDRYERERELEGELQSILSRISDAFYALDGEWRFTHVNERAEELLRHRRQELLGKTLWEVFPDTTETIAQDRFQQAMDTQDPVSFELEYEALDIWVEATAYPSESGLSVYFRDITERIERERALEKSNERLEQFAHAASHDLQEPLRMVSSYLSLIERRYGDRLDEDGQDFLEFAVDGADRMRDMIDGLLTYSRIESKGGPLEPVDLHDVYADACDNLRVAVAESDATITRDPLPRVVGDETQLRQLFQNVLDNAIEYSGEEPPQIHVGADRVTSMSASEVGTDVVIEDDDKWVLSVHDEGIGVAPEDHGRIFEVFQSVGRSNEHGSGLGLALCKRIVERHDGDIWIDSTPGDGTTVSFTLSAAGDGSD